MLAAQLHRGLGSLADYVSVTNGDGTTTHSCHPRLQISRRL